MTMDSPHDLIMRFRSPDQPGIIAGVTPLLAELNCDIREADIYGDPQTSAFFTRMRLSSAEHDLESLLKAMDPAINELNLELELFDAARKPRVLVAVSKIGHCLSDILNKWKSGSLPVDIVGVVSNHDAMRSLVEWHGLEYHHLPITKETKPEQEAAFKAVVEDAKTDLVVLARYMQILSNDFSAYLSGKCINIHHSFLPSFKGAKPYHQAHQRGVKLIGATAHFVTEDLDEGPIIEQDVRRVSHVTTADQMVEIGREVEASVLSRAIKWYAEHRVMLNGTRTVVLGA